MMNTTSRKIPVSGPKAARKLSRNMHDDNQQQRQQRQRQEHVGESHQEAVEPSEEAGENAHQGAEHQRYGSIAVKPTASDIRPPASIWASVSRPEVVGPHRVRE